MTGNTRSADPSLISDPVLAGLFEELTDRIQKARRSTSTNWCGGIRSTRTSFGDSSPRWKCWAIWEPAARTAPPGRMPGVRGPMAGGGRWAISASSARSAAGAWGSSTRPSRSRSAAAWR